MSIPENKPCSDDLFAEAATRMSLDEFATAGVVITVYSSVLDDTVLLASDDAVVVEGEGVVYRAAELRALHRLGADGLRQIHRFKRLLGGAVESVVPRDHVADAEPVRTSA